MISDKSLNLLNFFILKKKIVMFAPLTSWVLGEDEIRCQSFVCYHYTVIVMNNLIAMATSAGIPSCLLSTHLSFFMSPDVSSG